VATWSHAGRFAGRLSADRSGQGIGAIGCSGGTGEQDAAACKAGADLVK
jgi:uncharacterized protein GlcG (DUF336 family)